MRGPADPLRRIEDVCFERIAIATDGNPLIGGQPDATIRRLTFRDVRLTLRDPVTLSAHGGKPSGNVLFGRGTGPEDHSRVDADLVLAHVDGLTIERMANDGGSHRQRVARSHVRD